MLNGKYCESLSNYKRRKSTVVDIGGIRMGGDFPIRIQSMANTATGDIQASVDQCIRIIQAGADYVRFTVPSIEDVNNLKIIKNELRKRGYSAPLIADIHFNPEIALLAADVVEKVRINPGNYTDKKNSRKVDFSDEDYQTGLLKLKDKFIPLLENCRKKNVAIRIGVNHGSLSDRIMSRYGDTPEGMAESAMEFLRICRDENFKAVVVSMKASNILVMVQATRLVVKKMIDESMHFPVHLGVTEAGDGEDGRIKSAAGIGALLVNGIGDTIRVSLTEDPEAEIPVAQYIVKHFDKTLNHPLLPEIVAIPWDPFSFSARKTKAAGNIGGNHLPVVIGEVSSFSQKELLENGWLFDTKTKTWSFCDQASDFIWTNIMGIPPVENLPASKGIIIKLESWIQFKSEGTYPIFSKMQYLQSSFKSPDINFVYVIPEEVDEKLIQMLSNDSTSVIVCQAVNRNITGELYVLFAKLIDHNCHVPVVVKYAAEESVPENFQLQSALDVSGCFIDGLPNGLWLANCKIQDQSIIVSTAFGILQACRARISKTEFISCPSCGRTHFNLMKTVALIKDRTSHLKGLKIGVMGCIVNGPGEMADADYGYVGTGEGKITLYKSKQVIKRSIPEDEAVEELVNLIKQNGDWTEP